MCKEYNGWTNYQTWVTHLWLTNEQELNYRVLAALQRSDRAEGVEWLQLFIPRLCGEDVLAGLASDLMGHAIRAINWDELYDAFTEE